MRHFGLVEPDCAFGDTAGDAGGAVFGLVDEQFAGVAHWVAPGDATSKWCLLVA